MSDAKPRVLLVEDEDIISMLVEDMLDALGYDVTATAATLQTGIDAAESGAFDVAVLDVNLRGIHSFPIADVLSEKGVPFIFVTGYGANGIEPRFAGVPVLQKPYNIALFEKLLHDASRPGRI